jgi:hypothetical protein
VAHVTCCGLRLNNHSRALPQRDGCVRPPFAGRVEGSEWNVIIFNARDVLDEAVAVTIYRCGRRNVCAFSLFSLPPFLFAPFLFLFPLHCWCFGILHLEPIGDQS